MKIVDVARETNLNRNTITLLYKETAVRVDFETVDKLCDLFKCRVEDLFEKVWFLKLADGFHINKHESRANIQQLNAVSFS